MVFELKRPEKAAALYEGWNETIIWSCLQNVMGKVYADSIENPSAAMAVLGDFCFFAGTPDKEFIMYRAAWSEREFMIMVPQSEEWSEMIEECYGEKAKRVSRYAIKKEPGVFDEAGLRMAVKNLSGEYEMKMIDRDLFYKCRGITWCRDLVGQYDDYEMYQRLGLGVMILKNGDPVSGASSYASYSGGIEIDTREDYRRKGLAFACGAKLILECLERGWYPSWDAQNIGSVKLAEKLGYHYDYAYPVYEIRT